MIVSLRNIRQSSDKWLSNLENVLMEFSYAREPSHSEEFRLRMIVCSEKFSSEESVLKLPSPPDSEQVNLSHPRYEAWGSKVSCFGRFKAGLNSTTPNSEIWTSPHFSFPKAELFALRPEYKRKSTCHDELFVKLGWVTLWLLWHRRRTTYLMIARGSHKLSQILWVGIPRLWLLLTWVLAVQK